MTLTAEWIDKGREPQCPPLPQFPNGTDIDASNGASRTCSMELPYPAPRCGIYVVKCDKCGLLVGFTTAGRPDDPRKVTIACFSNQLEPNPPGMMRVCIPDTARNVRTPHAI